MNVTMFNNLLEEALESLGCSEDSYTVHCPSIKVMAIVQDGCKTYLKTLLEICHSLAIEEAEAVDGSLVRNVPHG